ncbi:YtxH domain-containing protein [Pontibacter harenae]|uniref:YtxH domain-containing protein n=1 Tax=Pontibacter harenae TaxID=2894083 RepID=UPI001E64B6EA|nr:YtxH domain-containing protein [Pontibacter harenae]MCC9169046.1 YtxH domain-containing protein [Pontibacter harenae]
MKDNSGKVLLALLAGASAGVIAGLLMAPDTGEVTRTSVKKWAGKMSKDLEKNLQTSLDEIKKMSSDTYEKVATSVKGATKGEDSGSDSSSDKSTSTTAATGTGTTTTGATAGTTGTATGPVGTPGTLGGTV